MSSTDKPSGEISPKFTGTLISKILVPVDGSEHAAKAVAYAVYLAKKCEANITLIHVVEIPHGITNKLLEESLKEIGNKILDTELKNVKAVDLSVRSILEIGSPTEKIIQVANDERYDLIIMGSQGMSRVKAFFLGDVSRNVSYGANCPVLIVR